MEIKTETISKTTMDLRTETVSKTTIVLDAVIDTDFIKTHACDIGEWWGEEICEDINLNHIVNNIEMPLGKYKITMILEKII
jgi:hypothetical protein